MNLILHLIMWPIFGGIESNLINILSNYPDKKVHHVVAYAQSRNNGIDGYYPGKTKLQEKIDTIPNAELIKRGTVDTVDINDLIKLTLKLKPDVIHVTKEHDFPIAFALNLLLGTPIVPVLNQVPAKLFPEFFPIYPAMFKEYPHYTASDFAGVQCLENYHHNWPTEILPNFIALPNCVDAVTFAPNTENRTALRARYAIADDTLVIGSVGVLDERKRQIWILQALADMLEKDPHKNICVMLVGWGHLEKQLKEYVAKYNLEKNVIFTGLQDTIAPFYNAFDIYAHPSEAEACPLAVLEALASGLPVVMYSPQAEKSGFEKIYNIITDHHNGHAIRTNKPEAFSKGLQEVVNNNDYRATLAQNARPSINELSAPQMALKYHEIFTAASQRPRFTQRQKFKTLFNYYFPLSD